jgi:hypothetical protein
LSHAPSPTHPLLPVCHDLSSFALPHAFVTMMFCLTTGPEAMEPRTID